MANTIDPNMYLSNQTEKRTPGPDLGKDDFLKILMTQLQNQDPLDPMDDKDFVEQMATFSSLEQQMNMADSIDSIVENQMVSPVVQYSHMIGKEVSYTDDDGESQFGEVISVSQKEGLPVLELSNGEKIYADIIDQVGNVGELDGEEDVEEDEIIGEPDGETDE